MIPLTLSFQLHTVATAIESCKLLCNLLFNSKTAQHLITEFPFMAPLMKRIEAHDRADPYDIKLFDLRLLFLVTALNPSSRVCIAQEHAGVKTLVGKMIEMSETIEVSAAVFASLSLSMILESHHSLQGEKTVNLTCEVLKVLFNLYISTDDAVHLESQLDEKLMTRLRSFLLNKGEKRDDLIRWIWGEREKSSRAHCNKIYLLSV